MVITPTMEASNGTYVRDLSSIWGTGKLLFTCSWKSKSEKKMGVIG